ncbi:heparinase II/III domain-containing protein [Paenibacillus swuensis]|uniref:heparinase II/III domain-containing protein n=1 Tax=Paenibacillus swuensis TaxID=1178515 RepID=UPI00083933D4|nr:heparinase II/III family protein [Paenibacillus swuensis]
MIFGKFGGKDLEQHLIRKEQFTLFPPVTERTFWTEIPAEVKKSLIVKGERYLAYEWPALTAEYYMEFSRTGYFDRMDNAYLARRSALGTLITAECIENQDRFTDDILNGIWCICEETSWIGVMHNDNAVLPNGKEHMVELRSAETGALLSWAYYLLHAKIEKIAPMVNLRIKETVQTRVLDPYMTRDDYRWMGFARQPVNNWNPWINSCILTAVLLLEDNHEERAQMFRKVMRSLDVFIDGYEKDGGCDEGTSYWDRAGGSLLECLELLHHASDGWIDIYKDAHIQEIGRFIYKTHINESYFINFADGSAKIYAFQSALAYKYGIFIQDELLMNQAANQYKISEEKFKQQAWFPMSRMLSEIQLYKEMINREITVPYLRDVWMDGIEVMAARERHGSSTGLYLAAKGGHNDESHNHNDIGQFIVYSDGQPVIIDAGVNSYNKKTFSEERYSLWTMKSSYHNVPTIRGYEQLPGPAYKAKSVTYSSNEERASLTMDITDAYPLETGLIYWIRNVALERKLDSLITVEDQFQFHKESSCNEWHLLTCCVQEELAQGKIVLFVQNGRNVLLHYDAMALEFSVEVIDTPDIWMNKVWGDCIYRLNFRMKDASLNGSNHFKFEQIPGK